MTAFAITDNLEWQVEQRPIYYPDHNGNMIRLDDKVAIIRSDNEIPLGVVSGAYETVQNRDLLRLVNPMVEEGILTIANIGHLNHGAKVFIQAQIAQEFQVLGEDYKAFITLLNGHVGNHSVAIGPSNVRVICNNTFAMSYASIENKFRHHEGVNERVMETAEVIDFVNEAMAAYSANAEKLAKASCSANQFSKFLEGVYDKEIVKMRDSLVETLNGLFYNGAGNEGKTFYDAVNAITDYSSNHSRKTEDGRFNYANFGRGSTLNLKAMEVALEMVA